MGRRKKDPNQRYVNRGHTRWVERLRASLGFPAPWLPPRHGEHLRRLLELQGDLLTVEELLDALEKALALTWWTRTWGAMAPRRARGEAKKELAALDALPTFEERFEAVRTEDNPKRFSSPELARRLLVRARAALPGDLEASETWARLALEIASRGETPDHRARQAHAWAFRANARRAQGHLQEAADGRKQICQLVEGTVLSDPRLLVDLDDLGASLVRDLGELEGALELLERVCVAAQLLGDERLVAKGLIGQGILLIRQGDFQESTERSTEALQCLGDHRDYSLTSHALSILSFGLCGLLRFEEAETLVTKKYFHFEGVNLVRLEWIKGTVARGLRQWGRAEEVFESTLRKMIDYRMPYEVALIGLDLAAVYLTIGSSRRVQAVKAIVEQALVYTLAAHPGSVQAYCGFCDCLQSLSAEDFAKRFFLLASRNSSDVETWSHQALATARLS